MKKIIILVICLLSLVSGTALANIDKKITENSINFENNSDYQLNTTDKININLYRYGYFDSMFGIKRTETVHILGLSLFPAPPYMSTEATFTTKNIPFFLIFNKELETKLTFKISSISSNYISYEVDNKILQKFVTADKVSLVLPLKNGSTQKIDISEETLKEWRFILTCNLWDEYKKGI